MSHEIDFIPKYNISVWCCISQRRRWGRGVGSGRGKMSGHGHQKSRSTPRAFEGGQTPLYKRLPKIGFHNPK